MRRRSAKWTGKTTADYLALDVRSVTAGTAGQCCLRDGHGLVSLSVRYKVSTDHSRLELVTADPCEVVELVRVPAGRGGTRLLAACPECSRSVARLYLPPPGVVRSERGFRCRKCYGLVYGSSVEGRLDRERRQVERLRKSLQAPKDWPLGVEPPRPARMRHVRYEALIATWRAAMARYQAHHNARLDRRRQAVERAFAGCVALQRRFGMAG